MTTTFGFDEQPASDHPLPTSIPVSAASTYAENELALRNMFVAEYLVDYDQVAAAQRCGFTFQFAVEFGRKFMEEPYVQQKISELRTLQPRNEETLLEYNKRRVMEQLMTEAHYRGPGSSQAARVAALKQLSDIYGMGSAAQARQQTASTQTAGGVMVVPAIVNLDDWEKVAKQNQKALQSDIAEDRQ